MPWFNFVASDNTDHVVYLTGQQAQALEFLGAPPYATQAEAAAATPRQLNADWNPVQGLVGAPAVQPVAAGVNKVTGAATSVGDFLSRLTSANLWMRVGEFVAGIVLLGIGVNALFKGKPLQVVTGAAGAVGKVVP